MTQEIGIASGRAHNLPSLLTVFPFKLCTALVGHVGPISRQAPKHPFFA